MLGMYAVWFTWSIFEIDPILGSPLAFIIIFFVGYVIQKFFIHHIMKAPAAAQIFLTVGLMVVLENMALMVFGSDFRSVAVTYQTESIHLGEIFISKSYLYAFLAALVITGLLWTLLATSWIGRAIRAVAQDAMMAELVGVNATTTYNIAFGLGVGLTAFGGAVILPYISVSPTIGSHFSVLMFTVVVLGGLGSVAGALAGGIVVGVIQSLSSLVFPIHLQNLILFIIFIAVLVVRPNGLLKEG